MAGAEETEKGQRSEVGDQGSKVGGLDVSDQKSAQKMEGLRDSGTERGKGEVGHDPVWSGFWS